MKGFLIHSKVVPPLLKKLSLAVTCPEGVQANREYGTDPDSVTAALADTMSFLKASISSAAINGHAVWLEADIPKEVYDDDTTVRWARVHFNERPGQKMPDHAWFEYRLVATPEDDLYSIIQGAT